MYGWIWTVCVCICALNAYCNQQPVPNYQNIKYKKIMCIMHNLATKPPKKNLIFFGSSRVCVCGCNGLSSELTNDYHRFTCANICARSNRAHFFFGHRAQMERRCEIGWGLPLMYLGQILFFSSRSVYIYFVWYVPYLNIKYKNSM